MNTNFTDSSASAHVMTLVNTPTIDTVTTKFGAGSGKFVLASNQYLTGTTSSDYAFGTGDWTIDFWVNFLTSLATAQTLVCIENTTNGIDITPNSTTNMHGFVVGSSFDITMSAISTGTWYHFALVRSSGSVTFYLNGTKQGASAALAGSVTNSIGITVGNRSDHGSPMGANMDELRVSSNARWTANFTAPTVEYS